jgi:hypothetical protein
MKTGKIGGMNSAKQNPAFFMSSFLPVFLLKKGTEQFYANFFE